MTDQLPPRVAGQDFRCDKHTNEFKEWCVELRAYVCHSCVFDAGVASMMNSTDEQVEIRRRTILALVQNAMLEQRNETQAIQWAYARKVTEQIVNIFRS